jgi:hypothetical protein
MKRKLMIVVLSLALVAGAVAVGIHVLHQEALANVTYIVEIVDEALIPVEAGTVQFSFDDGVIWLDAVWVGDGRYSYLMASYQGSWLIRLIDPAIEPPNQVEGSASAAFHHWEVDLDD